MIPADHAVPEESRQPAGCMKTVGPVVWCPGPGHYSQ